MHWNKHSEIEGSHAFLSASKYHWLRYDEDKLVQSFVTAMAAAQGTADHEFAALCIQRRQKLPKTRQTLNMYVNDAVGFAMDAEVQLMYSRNAYGTADAIKFTDSRGKKTLRIHDLKTGVGHASMDQPMIYAGFFCLEYDFTPSELDIELRIYQNDDYEVFKPDLDDMVHVIDRIITADRIIENIRKELL